MNNNKIEVLNSGRIQFQKREKAKEKTKKASKSSGDSSTVNKKGTKWLFAEYFNEIVKNNPDVNAIVYDRNETLTYAALKRRVDRLACCLLNRCHSEASQAKPIAIYMEQSEHLAPALLAALRAGIPFVPLSTQMNPQRLQYIIKHCEVRTVLVDKMTVRHFWLRSLKALPEIIETESIYQESHWDNETELLTRIRPPPDSLAYIIYSSGSGGKPKGIKIPHRGIMSAVKSAQMLFDFKPGDHVAQFADIAFDASWWEMLVTLGSGATLYPVPSDIRLNSQKLALFYQKHKVSHAVFTPSLLRLFSREKFKDLTHVLVTGEVLNNEVLKNYGVLYNLYGPSETTFGISMGRCTLDTGVHVGVPFVNSCVLLLPEKDESHQNEPFKCIAYQSTSKVGKHEFKGKSGRDNEGEIWIAGPGVGLG